MMFSYNSLLANQLFSWKRIARTHSWITPYLDPAVHIVLAPLAVPHLFNRMNH